MHSAVLVAYAAVAAAQFVPPPAPVLLTETKSGVLPVLPPMFTGVETLEGAIIMKAPVNASYLPVNGPAQVQSNLPAATYVATLPAVAFDELTGTVISGTIQGSAKQGDTGVTFTVTLSNIPDLTKYGGNMSSIPYHIHDMAVPASGNCTETLGHFDYTNFGEYYTCDKTNPQNCQIGDLAGKHGRINATTFSATYVDEYLSTDPSSPYFFGAKSIVIHTANTTRLTCANFMMMQGSSSTSSSSASASAPVQTYQGAATKNFGSMVGGLAALMGLIIV